MKKWHRLIQRTLRSQRGFTLLEIVLGMMISTILLTSIASATLMLQQNYITGIELNYSRLIANNVADAVKNQIAFSYITEITAESITYLAEDGTHTINFTDENPMIPGLSYDPDYYIRKIVTVSVVPEAPFEGTVPPQQGVYHITVTVHNTVGQSRTPYVLTRSVRQINFR